MSWDHSVSSGQLATARNCIPVQDPCIPNLSGLTVNYRLPLNCIFSPALLHLHVSRQGWDSACLLVIFRVKTGVVAWLNRVGKGQGFNPSIYRFSTNSAASPCFALPPLSRVFVSLGVLGSPVLYVSPNQPPTGTCDIATATCCIGYCFPICFVCSKKICWTFLSYCLFFSSLRSYEPAPLKSSFIGGIPEGEEIEACGKLATLTQKFLCSIFFNRKKNLLFI